MERVDIEKIDKYAFVPQCSDNQFIPDKLLKDFNPQSKKHQKIRYDETKKELVRSMIYSSQLLINRVAFFNNDVFLDFYTNKEDKDSLVKLFNSKRIIPVLYNEDKFNKHEIITKNSFTLNDRIELFFDFLDNEVSDSNIVYLTTTKNQNVMDSIRSFFPSLRGWLQTITVEEVRTIVKELNPVGLKNEIFINQFRSHLQKLADDWVNFARSADDANKPFGREQYYAKWIVKKGSDPVDMYIDFKKNFAIETKKIFDLSYCYNLASSYDRYFFCPEGMPSPLVIPGALRGQSYKPKNTESYKKAIEREELIYKAQETYSVPNALKLTLSQVVAIQSTEEWQYFIKHQRKLFNDPSTWNKDAIKEYSKVLGNLYIKIKTDYKDFPFYDRVYLGIKIVIKFSKYTSDFIDMSNTTQVIDAVNEMINILDLFKDQTITGVIKIKHFILNEESKIIEEFATGLSEIELEKSDLNELKYNFSSLDFTKKSNKESEAQR